MKRIINLLICVCLIIGVCPLNVTASEVQKKYFKASVNGKTQFYECLWDNIDIYCSVENLAEMTNYGWSQIEDDLKFEFFREFENDRGDYGIELQTGILVNVNENKRVAKIETMHESYSVDCYVENGMVFLPLEKLLYLLHAKCEIVDDVVFISSMLFTILDFMAIHSTDLGQIASKSEDVLIDTGWLLSDNKWGQAVYSAIAEVFKDFDGKIFMLWWPEEGHVKTAESYEKAILQLAKKDKEFLGKEVQTDAMEMVINSIFSYNSDYHTKAQNIMSVPQNIDDIVQSIPDAVSLLEKMGAKNKAVGNIAKQIENGEIDSSFLQIPELNGRVKQLQQIGDGFAILQCVWNACDTASRVSEWNDEYLKQLHVLADYENPGYVNENVVSYVQSSAHRLIDSYNAPTKAATNEFVQSSIGLLLSKTFEESPFGKVFSIMGTVGDCYGTFDVDFKKKYDVYSELSVTTFSIKIEQLVQELLKYEDLLNTTEKLTNERIEKVRNQLMLYLRLNLRNKAQLYNLNIRGNKNENWINSAEAKELYNEIVKVYALLAELSETKTFDKYIVLSENYGGIEFVSEELAGILTDNVSAYTWVVAPTIEADDIYYLADYPNAENSINELSKQADNSNAIIQIGSELGIIDLNGELLTEIVYKEISCFGDIYMMIRTIPEYSEEYHREWDTYCLNKNGEIKASVGNGNLVLTVYYYYEGNRQRAGNFTREIVQDVIPVQEASEYAEPYALKSLLNDLNGKYALEHNGKLITDFIYDECGSLADGLLAVCQNGKWGYVDEKGQVVIPIEYDASWKQYPVFDMGSKRSSNNVKDYCYAASDGYVVLCQDEEWEIKDINGNDIISKGIFEAIRPVFNGKCWVKQDGKWGVIQVATETNNLQSLDECSFRYINGEFLSDFSISEEDGKKNAGLLFWHNYGESSSDEDFFFEWENGKWEYEVVGNRSKKKFLIEFTPVNEGMTIKVICLEGNCFSWETGKESDLWINTEYKMN